MAESDSITSWKVIVALSLVHFSGDFYSAFISPLYPVFMENMGLNLAQVGLLAGISRFLMFIVQPMSIYNTAVTLAFGVGPIFITWYVARFGLGAMPATMSIGLLIWIYFYWVIPKPRGDDMAQYGFLKTLRQTLGSVWQPILLIWIVMVRRALVGQSLMTFISEVGDRRVDHS